VPDAQRSRNDDLHAQVLDVLLSKVRSDPFPSPTHLDMIEGMLGTDDKADYAEALLDKVRDELYPSLDHLRRLQALL
jgi:hypothetical protein